MWFAIPVDPPFTGKSSCKYCVLAYCKLIGPRAFFNEGRFCNVPGYPGGFSHCEGQHQSFAGPYPESRCACRHGHKFDAPNPPSHLLFWVPAMQRPCLISDLYHSILWGLHQQPCSSLQINARSAKCDVIPTCVQVWLYCPGLSRLCQECMLAHLISFDSIQHYRVI